MGWATRLSVWAALGLAFAGVETRADVPGRNPITRTTAGNPGTQELDLPNISAGSGFHNVFEPGTECAKCHTGRIDQQAGHFGNWAGTNMASAGRDPIFRANQIRVNRAIQASVGLDGAGNVCFRCHSPNGWHSGKLNPSLGGKGDGSLLVHDKLSAADATDDEGVLCEMCHRTLGAVKMPADALPLGPVYKPEWGATAHPYSYADPAFNMLAGLDDWPHLGNPYPFGPLPEDPLGDATLQINGRAPLRGGKYPGSVDVYWSDRSIPGTPYTGQTYAVFPPDHPFAGQPVVLPDGTIPLHYEDPITDPPVTSAISPEHATHGPSFVTSAEFCGACHDLTIPILNHGMPEQRTYSEWRYSDFGRLNVRCQDCHMPTLKHELTDAEPVSVNCDPEFTGPLARNRNPWGGTTFHKFAGANRDLPEMMKRLYPEVDLANTEVSTGRDTTQVPGLMSSRDLSWDRARRNTELSLRDAMRVELKGEPRYIPGLKKWEVKVKVSNLTGHRIPSGYPDGRRVWLELAVTDAGGRTVYQSGHYDPASGLLFTAPGASGLVRAQRTLISDAANAVMVYEKRTARRDPATGKVDAAHELDLLNDIILFDNRIPPAGFTNAEYSKAGTKFMNFDRKSFEPFEETDRFPDGVNYDLVKYRFSAPPDARLRVVARLYYQSHSREFMEFLKDNDDSTLRPEGPPAPGARDVPVYLSDVIGLSGLRDLDGKPFRDNWGGIAFASWMLAGKGAPFLIAAADSAVAEKPAAPSGVAASALDAFAVRVSWSPVPNADGYVVWTRYGASEATASWDRLAVVRGTTEFVNDGLRPGKTYGYRIEAFNWKGAAFSQVVTAIPASTVAGPAAR